MKCANCGVDIKTPFLCVDERDELVEMSLCEKCLNDDDKDDPNRQIKKILKDIDSGELIILATNSINSEWDKVVIGENHGNLIYGPSKHFYLNIRLTMINKENKENADKGETK